MNKIIDNCLDIKIKTITYDAKSEELDIRVYPIVGWRCSEDHFTVNDDWGDIPIHASPIIPGGAIFDSPIYYEWEKNTYDDKWNPITYVEIKEKLINENCSPSLEKSYS